MSNTEWVFEVDEAGFQGQVLERSHERPVIVDFWAEWCGPCRMLGPILERLVQERKGEVLLAKIDIDRSQELAVQYGINAIPAIIAFRDGKPVLDFVGVLPEDQLRAFVDRLAPSEADRLAQRAAAAEKKNPVEAEALNRQALQRDDHHQAALAGLARLLLEKGADEEATELLARINPGGEQAAEGERLSALVSLRQLARGFGDEAAVRRRLETAPDKAQLQYELGCILAGASRYSEALDVLLQAAEADKKLGASQVRQAMVKIFQVIGIRSEMADQYRDRLTRLLY
ncbi:MAG TPA: thioredoxin [Gemmataceae bacterium]|nr:thioredoxin [Gemmataceae bacterium]